MALLPQQPEDSKTVRAIYAAYEREHRESPRSYLGASQIGGACERALWYGFRHCGAESFGGRMLRLFETGDREEPRFVANLRAIGCEVYDVDPDTGRQFEVKDLAGHFAGHMDGCARGVPEAPKAWHVLEFKTHNTKSFADLKRQGVKESKPRHYAQMMVYMHLTGMRRALYLAVCKDTDYLHSERIRYDKAEAEAFMVKAQRIIESATPPPRFTDNPDHFECAFCAFRHLCHGGGSVAVPAPVSCRNCVHATPEMDTGYGRWSCAKHRKTISRQEQDRACPDHLFIPDLIMFAERDDAGADPGGDWISYRNPDGTTWRNSKGGNDYSSQELAKLPAPMVGAGTVDQVKRVFPCTVEGATNT